jgi:L-iditol 2-dehydrogenase
MVDEWTGGRGVDVVLEATNSPAAFSHAVDSVRIDGRVVLVGIPEGDKYDTMPPSTARRKGLTIKFARRMGDVYSRAIQMVRANRVELEPIVTHRVALEDAPSAIAMQAEYRDRVIKVMVS